MIADFVANIEQDGFAVVPHVLSAETIRGLLDAIQGAGLNKDRAGTRRLLAIRQVFTLATEGAVPAIAQHVLALEPFPVRAILFDKQPSSNWKLAYHQDRAIAVKEKRDIEGFVGWSVKEGVPHVLPPAYVLQSMVSIRLHLDECGADNGPLRVSPGTHKLGLLDKSVVPATVTTYGEVVCTCSAGDALVMRPLLLHASGKSTNPSHRRVIHIEYAHSPLPGGLEWYERG